MKEEDYKKHKNKVNNFIAIFLALMLFSGIFVIGIFPEVWMSGGDTLEEVIFLIGLIGFPTGLIGSIIAIIYRSAMAYDESKLKQKKNRKK